MSVGVPVRDVTKAKLLAEARTEAPAGRAGQGGRAARGRARGPGRARRGAASPFLLLVDGVTDPGNLGALLRSAECAGVTGVVLPRHRAVHVTPTVTKAAAGAVEYLPMALVGGLPTAIRQLQQAGVWVVGLDAAGDQPLFDLPPRRRPGGARARRRGLGPVPPRARAVRRGGQHPAAGADRFAQRGRGRRARLLRGGPRTVGPMTRRPHRATRRWWLALARAGRGGWRLQLERPERQRRAEHARPRRHAARVERATPAPTRSATSHRRRPGRPSMLTEPAGIDLDHGRGPRRRRRPGGDRTRRPARSRSAPEPFFDLLQGDARARRRYSFEILRSRAQRPSGSVGAQPRHARRRHGGARPPRPACRRRSR